MLATICRAHGGAGAERVSVVSAPVRMAPTASFSPNCASLTNVNGLLYCAVDDDGDFKLWRSDGTEAGTVLVTERKYDRNWIKLVGNRLAAVTPIGGATFFTTARLSETRPETLRMELWHVPAPR